MAYVTVPKDLTRVKSKVLFNLTKRQLLCFGAALLVGVPLFFLLRGSASTTTAALCMIFAMLPGFLFALYERHGQPLEVIAGQMVQTLFIRPKQRPYQTNNLYAAFMRQAQMEQEVKAIVQKSSAARSGKRHGKTKADPRRKAADRSRH
ncbi:MAG: PrgI family protein [Clostridia bacterium]